MDLKVMDLISKMEVDNPDASYFEGGSFAMTPTYHKNSNVLVMQMRLPRILPFHAWDVFTMRLKKLTRSQIQLSIISERTDASVLEAFAYIKHYVSLHPASRVFTDTMPALEDTFLVYRIADEKMRDEAIQTKHLLVDFLTSCGFQYQINIQDIKVKVKEIPTVSVVAQPRAASYGGAPSPEGQGSFKRRPKKSSDLDKFRSVGIQEIQQDMELIRIKGKIFDSEEIGRAHV